MQERKSPGTPNRKQLHNFVTDKGKPLDEEEFGAHTREHELGIDEKSWDRYFAQIQEDESGGYSGKCLQQELQ